MELVFHELFFLILQHHINTSWINNWNENSLSRFMPLPYMLLNCIQTFQSDISSWLGSLSLRKQRLWHFLWMCIVPHHTSLSGMLNEDSYCAQPCEFLQEFKDIVLLIHILFWNSQSEGQTITFLILAKV